MKIFSFFCLFYFPLVVASQVAITFSDEFNLTDVPQYDNWEFEGQSFFVLPLTINEYVAIENYQFNILYNPQIVQPISEIIQLINAETTTSNYSVESAVSGQQGDITAEVFVISSEQSIATISYSHSSPITQDVFENGSAAILLYLPFKKIDPCSKAPVSIAFSDGNLQGEYANPDQTNAFIINESLTAEGGNITTQNAFVNFNILSAEVNQNENILVSSINGGTPPYSYEWTDKMDVVLSIASSFTPEQTGDYLFYVYDTYNCVSTLYITYDQTASIKEYKQTIVYPNPATNYFEIITTEFTSYNLYNLNGQSLREGTIEIKELVFKENLESGVYFLELKNNNKKGIFKVIF